MLTIPLVLIALLAAAPAAASPTHETVFQDDRLLVFSDARTQAATLDELKALGVDTVHSLVNWSRLAPLPRAHRRPPAFYGGDPRAYPPTHWDRYDTLVRGTLARGMSLLLTPAGATPVWGATCRGNFDVRGDCPDPREFGRFVRAIARRYSGHYRDENDGRALLPRVTRWSVWNEPNHKGWLRPQYVGSKRDPRPASPRIYRRLVLAAASALRATGHTSDQLLLGETAPVGIHYGPLAKRTMPPVDFYRELFCLDRAGRRYRGRAARAHGCAGFRGLPVTGVSHHPYTPGAQQPPGARTGLAGNVTIGTIGRLERVLRLGVRARSLPRRALGIWFTEFGFQTRPPDRYGVTLGQHAEYMNQSAWIAYRHPLVRSIAQYELRDEAARDVFNTGLRFHDGRPKPALRASQLPIWVTRRGRGLRVFGQVRPLPDGAFARVEVQNRPRRRASWRTVRRVTTHNRKGFLVATLRERPGSWRLVWAPAGAAAVASRAARP